MIDAARRKIGFTQSTTGIDPKTRLVNNMLVCDFHDVQRWYVSNIQHKTKFSGGVSAAHNSATGITTVYQSPGYERVDLSSFRIVVEINYPPFQYRTFALKINLMRINGLQDYQVWLIINEIKQFFTIKRHLRSL